MYAIVWGSRDESGESISDERNGINKRPGGGTVGQCLENRDMLFIPGFIHPLEFGVTVPPATFLPKSTSIIAVGTEKFFQSVYEDNSFNSTIYSDSEIIRL